jgi:hypothetical protein
MYREFRDSREGFDAETAAEYEAWLDDRNAEWDMSEYDDEPEPGDEPWDGFRDDVEADADVLRMCGMGTDEDYGYYEQDGGDYGYYE